MPVSGLFLIVAVIAGIGASGLLLRSRRRRAERLEARRVRREEMDRRWREATEQRASNDPEP